LFLFQNTKKKKKVNKIFDWSLSTLIPMLDYKKGKNETERSALGQKMLRMYTQ
jgi:hypothetical protein